MKQSLITLLLLTLAMASCGQKPTKEQQARNMEEHMTQAGYDGVQLYRTKTGHLTATITINGERAVMLLDTGGGATVIDLKRMEKYSLEAKPTGDYAAGIGVEKAALGTAKADIAIGETVIKGFDLYVMDMYNVNTTFKRHHSMQVDGVLGSDLIERFSAVIDYGNLRLYVKTQK